MNFNIPPLLAYVASWGTSMGVVWSLFEKAETALNDDARKKVSHWLKNIEPQVPLAGWRSTFGAMFDRVFGERHLSWQCFLRSSIASLAAIAITTLLWRALRPNQFLAFMAGDKRDYSTATYPFWIFGIATLVNLFPDYLALLKTRYVIRRLSSQQSHLWGWVSFDVLLTVSIWGVVTLAVMLATFWVGVVFQKRIGIEHPAVWMLGDWPEEFPGFVGILDLSSSSSAMPPWGLFFYSTFFTSIWLWMYIGGGAVIRTLNAVGLRLIRLRGFLDIDEKPLRTVGFVCMLLVSIVYLVMPFLKYLK